MPCHIVGKQNLLSNLDNLDSVDCVLGDEIGAGCRAGLQILAQTLHRDSVPVVVAREAVLNRGRLNTESNHSVSVLTNVVIDDNFHVVEDVGFLFVGIDETDWESASIMLLHVSAVHGNIGGREIVNDPVVVVPEFDVLLESQCLDAEGKLSRDGVTKMLELICVLNFGRGAAMDFLSYLFN